MDSRLLCNHPVAVRDVADMKFSILLYMLSTVVWIDGRADGKHVFHQWPYRRALRVLLFKLALSVLLF
jgi:hypothetical protein